MAFVEKNISASPRETVMAASGDLAQLSASGQARLYRHVMKRGLDILLVLLAAPFWLPLVLVGAALVMLDGHSPFYTQPRVGRNGRVFRIWKLRSMVPNADARLEAYLAANPEARAEWDATQKLKNDPRITAVGRILRKTSLDELPQLLNVLTGDMSLVGPRPIMVSQKPLYPGRRYYDMRPGLTGLWQISDRNECSFVQRVVFDDTYHRAMSFWTDAKIIARTFGVVMRGTGY
jgi:exopolysaccharide production protein ExoY